MIHVEYSVLTLKHKLMELNARKRKIESGEWHTPFPKREETKLIHQIADLEAAIEVLEEYVD